MPGTFSTDLTTLTTADAITGYTAIGTFSVSPRIDTGVKVQGTNGLIGSGPSAANGTVWWKYTLTSADLTDGRHIFPWAMMTSLGVADTKANGGVRIAAGSGAGTASGTFPTDGLTAGKCWRVDGIDSNRYSGWTCYVVDPNGTPDFTTGTPNMATTVWIAVGLRSTAAILDTTFNFCVDALRLGKGHTVIDGTTGAPVTFADIIAYDSNNTNVFGVFIQAGGVYQLSGKMTFGTTGQVAVTVFKEASKTLLFPDLPVSATHYELIGNGAASFLTTITFGTLSGSDTSGGCTISALGAAKWAVTANANSKFQFYGCNLSGLRASVLNSISDMRNTSLSACADITTGGATITGCQFQNGSATYALIIASAAEAAVVTACAFSGMVRAIKITAIGTYTFDNLKFSGNTYDVENSSAGLVTINATNGSNPATVINTGGGSVTINNSVTLTVTVKDDLGVAIQNVRVSIHRTSDALEILNALTNASGVATTTYNYTVDVPITIRVRKNTTGSTRYVNQKSSGTITISGYSSIVTLSQDTVASA